MKYAIKLQAGHLQSHIFSGEESISELVLSGWALESALGFVLKFVTNKSLSKDEISNLAVDKYEKVEIIIEKYYFYF